MRLLVTPGQRRRETPSTPNRTRDRALEPVCTPRRVPADPYAAWVRQREAEREANRLRTEIARNPGAAWENMRVWDPSQSTGVPVRLDR